MGTYHLGIPDVDRLGVTGSSLLAVCVSDNGRFTVYLGICQLPQANHRLYGRAREMKSDKIMKQGTKLPFSHAKCYFPNLDESQYNK